MVLKPSLFFGQSFLFFFYVAMDTEFLTPSLSGDAIKTDPGNFVNDLSTSI